MVDSGYRLTKDAPVQRKIADSATTDRSRLSLRGRLVLLVVATALPLLAFGLFGTYLQYQTERDNIGRYTLQIARSLAEAVEADYRARISGLQALALAHTLRAADIDSFRQTAQAFLASQPTQSTLGLADESGQLLLAVGNVPASPNRPLPKRRNMAPLAKVFQTGQPVVSDLFSNALTGRISYTVDVPVLLDGRVVYDLGLDPTPSSLQNLIIGQHLDETWFVSIVDSKGVIVARRPDGGGVVGEPASARLRAALLNQAEGVLDSISLEGTPLLAGFSQVPSTGWSVAVGVPYTQVTGPLRHTVFVTLGVAAPLLALSLVLSTFVARRIARPIASLASVAATGRRSMTPIYRATGLREVDEVGDVLTSTVSDLIVSRARYQMVLDTAIDYGIITTDLNGTVSSWSAGARHIFGWNDDEAVGQHLRLIFVSEDQAAGVPEAEMQTALAQGLAGDVRWHVRKDGSRFWADGEAQPMRDSDGRVVGYLKILRDRTQARAAEEAMRRLADSLEQTVEERTIELTASNVRLVAEMQRREASEDQLRQLQKMEAVGQLTGGLAHDFNNLLAGISGTLELMQIRLQQGRLTDIERYMTAAQGSAKRAAALTHRLLAFSRRQTLEPKPTDVNRLVSGIEELIQRTVGPSIAVEVVGATNVWPALVDPSQLENALLNLCINARDAMPDGGRITIETANKWLDERAAHTHDMPEGQYLSMCVTDTGTGMPPEVIARVFEPFFTTKPIGEGTGLGLSMIYGFAQQSGDQVRIYSEVGKGTTVCVYLPRHYGEVATEPTSKKTNMLPRTEQGETVLIVDDEPVVRMLVTDILHDLGYTAIEAGDSVAGLKVLQSGVRIDLLITDVGLPGGMNGRQMADAARVARPELKVLFITGYAENSILSNGHLAPGMAVLTKPFPVETMAARIRSMLVET